MWRRGVCLLAGAMALVACVTDREGGVSQAHTGERLYQVSCSGCHGLAADGNGPVAPYLNVTVPDLTRIAARRGGTFPTQEVFRIVDGQSELRAHGARHMPVWGYEFFGDDPDDEVAHRQATQKVESLVSYLRSIQRTE